MRQARRMVLRALFIGLAAMVVLIPSRAAFAEPTPAELEQQIQTTGDALEDVIEAYNRVNEELKVTQAAIDDLSKRMEPLLGNMNAAYQNVDEIAVTAYKTSGPLQTWSVLLNAGSSDSFVDQLTALEHLSRGKQRDIAGFTQVRAEYETERKRLDSLLTTQNGQKADIEARKTKIEGDLAKLKELKKKAEANRPKTTTTTTTTNTAKPAVSGKAGLAVNFAYAQLGKPYSYGADGPDSYDCSGLTQKAWAAAGVPLPHNAAMQWDKVKHISRSALAPGDLVFYRNLGHVAIYVGNETVIHAPTTGDVVKTAGVDRMGSAIYGYGRPGA